jgi:alkylation response protein AidB-like acyl-CoA dehydrogenase
VAYAKERIQFGRPIGSFQVVKHRCSDMLIALEASRVILAEATEALETDNGSPSTAVSMAKSYCCDAAARIAGDAIQLHGGIGFTWEHDLHLLLKRAKLNQALYGDSRFHRRLIAHSLLGTPGAS